MEHLFLSDSKQMYVQCLLGRLISPIDMGERHAFKARNTKTKEKRYPNFFI